MRRDIPNPRMPSLSQQLFVLPPSAKLIAGSFMILLALGAMLMMPGSFYSWLLLLVAGAIALRYPLGLERHTEIKRLLDERRLAEAH